MAQLIFVHVYCAPNFAAGPQSHVRAAVFAPYRAQIRGPSGLARVLPRRNGIMQAVVGAWALAFKNFVGLCGCCSICVVAGVVRSNRVGGLCLPWMWMMCDVSMFPSFRPAASVSSCRLPARLRVGILNFACPCARGEFCDVFGAEAGFSRGRCCAASLCSILCWY